MRPSFELNYTSFLLIYLDRRIQGDTSRLCCEGKGAYINCLTFQLWEKVTLVSSQHTVLVLVVDELFVISGSLVLDSLKGL